MQKHQEKKYTVVEILVDSKTSSNFPLYTLTAAALVLPGIIIVTAQAAEDDSVDFQYSHYQEGKRGPTFTDSFNSITFAPVNNIKVPNNRNPIEVDSIHGSARVSLTDRIKFAFNYLEDTWSGATPYGSAPERSGALSYKLQRNDANGNPIITGASGYNGNKAYFDSQGNSLYRIDNLITGEVSFHKDPRTVHVIGYASPETRKQGDFKLSYDWDEAAVSVGGGISTEHDYESRFVNLGGKMDFNQKQTTVNLGLSYTNSDIHADPLGFGNHYTDIYAYADQTDTNPKLGHVLINGTRQDWATHLDLTHVVNKDTVVGLGMGYTRSTGFMENPYKFAWIFNISSTPDPSEPLAQNLPKGVFYGGGISVLEQRPDARNQWNWNLNWTQYIEPFDAATHFNYQFAHDDWGINAHTFDADWVQPLGLGWTITPRIRYYSQEAANFYQPYFVVHSDSIGAFKAWPEFFSSDQRLSGYGALSGGVTVSKQFTKSIGIEAGFEYYTHQGALKLGGGGEKDFADYDYWVANAALKVSLDSLGGGILSANQGDHPKHQSHSNIPSGVLFAHALDKVGDMMAGYRYMHNRQASSFLHGSQFVSQQQLLNQGCPDSQLLVVAEQLLPDGCSYYPGEMTMSMHMLELMVAPTDWLSLMLMPQFADMEMPIYPNPAYAANFDETHGPHSHLHQSGGIGDTGLYALVKLFDRPNHHIHTSLGVTAPTGDIGIKLLGEDAKNLDGPYTHYGMQLGSGTWDFKPSLTYLGNVGDWSWGAQVAGTKRLGYRNASGYKLGDMFEASVWGGYDITNWLSATVRMAYSWQGAIKGRFHRSTRLDYQYTCDKASFTSQNDTDFDGIPDGPFIFDQVGYDQCLIFNEEQKLRIDRADRPAPMDYPSNYGGHYVDLGLGISATVPSGSLAGNRLAFEWLQPVYTDVNGYQLDRDGALSFTWSYGF